MSDELPNLAARMTLTYSVETPLLKIPTEPVLHFDVLQEKVESEYVNLFFSYKSETREKLSFNKVWNTMEELSHQPWFGRISYPS